jgi:hypothetical protein
MKQQELLQLHFPEGFCNAYLSVRDAHLTMHNAYLTFDSDNYLLLMRSKYIANFHIPLPVRTTCFIVHATYLTVHTGNLAVFTSYCAALTAKLPARNANGNPRVSCVSEIGAILAS